MTIQYRSISWKRLLNQHKQEFFAWLDEKKERLLGMVQMRRFVLDSLVRERKGCKEAPSEDMVKEKETQPVLAGRNRCISLIVAQ